MMHHKNLLILIFVTNIALPLIQGIHVEKWHKLDSTQDIFIEAEAKYNWHKAWNECAMRNMSLIIVDSSEKSEALKNLLKQIFGSSPNLWIGGNDLAEEGNFVWPLTGKRIEFTNWSKGNPDNKVDEDCAHIWAKTDYEWNDAPCDMKIGFICEENHLVAEQRKQWLLKKQLIDRLFEL